MAKPGPKGPRPNRLNDLSPRDWLLFQKSWFVHNPPPREKGVLVHPAKFPETLVEEFICFFTKRNEVVFDPMVGTGSALIAAYNCGRRGIGIELSEKYAAIARQRLAKLKESIPLLPTDPEWKPCEQTVICADALELDKMDLPEVDYCITSPPYWDMLHAKGAFTQEKRRADDSLDVAYSDDPRDLGNLQDYVTFVETLCRVYRLVYDRLKSCRYLTIIVKNVKKGGRMYPLAWDLGRDLSSLYVLKDEKIWCQDNQRLAPYGLGNAWVSNTFHHYCLNFRKEE